MTTDDELDAQAERLFSENQEVLTKKSVATKHALTLLIERDFEKLTCALSTVQNDCAHEVVTCFFEGAPALCAMLLSSIDGPRLCHLGFEIHQPLAILTAKIPAWLELLSATAPDAPPRGFRLARVLRFPASMSFQKRVGAYAEIMRISIQAGPRELMLEVFDIHRRPGAPPGQRTLDGERRPAVPLRTKAPHESLAFERLFRGDPVWHYALYVQTAQKIIEFHAAFRELVARSPEYALAYAEPVTNEDDGSVHTKIIHRPQAIELEFITQLKQ